MASLGLATRCPVCSTVFRVVPDQLRVSEGWVRCGRCAEVFNASQSLVDMDTGAPRAAPDGLPGASPSTPRPVSPSRPAWPPSPPAADEPAAQRAPALVRDGAGRVQAPVEPPGPAAMPDAGQDDAPPDDPAWANDPITPLPPEQPDAWPVDPRAEPADRPAFVQQADRAAQWQRPRVRRTLALAAAAATLALLLQAAYQYRELLAAGWPATRPVLQQSCALLGCSINAPHLIDSLTVESSGLLRVEKTNTYSLSVGLRNRAGFEVALPALELSLTDSRGRLMARRVLNTRELGSPQNTLAAGGDINLQATLLMNVAAGPESGAQAEPQTDAQADFQTISGYTIELFYP